MTTAAAEKMGKRRQMTTLIAGRKAKLSESKKELASLGLELEKQQTKWAKLSIDGDPGSGPAKKKLDELKARYNEQQEKVASYQAVYEKNMADPKVQELGKAAIEEAKAKVQELGSKQLEAIDAINNRKEEIFEQGFRILEYNKDIKDLKSEIKDLHKQVYGNKEMLTLPHSIGKLYEIVPFYHDIIKEFGKRFGRKARKILS